MKETWKVFSVYMIILVLMLFGGIAFGQINVIHYNANWNDANKVDWLEKLTDCKIKYIDIADEPKYQKKHEIVVVPTIIIFKDGEEIKRFQADISFSMKATRKEIQGAIDDIIMSDF